MKICFFLVGRKKVGLIIVFGHLGLQLGLRSQKNFTWVLVALGTVRQNHGTACPLSPLPRYLLQIMLVCVKVIIKF